MGVSYILNQAGNKVGLNPANEQQRSVLLRFLNEGAIELYEEADIIGSLIEQVFKVNGDQSVTLPSYVGEVRAVREFNTAIPVHLNQMRPRYNVNNWDDRWRNWRIKSKQCLQKSIDNQSVVSVNVSVVEDPPISVTISGPTFTASFISETLVMDSVTKNTVNTFADITSLTKDRQNNSDVHIRQIDGTLLSTIPNNTLEASYVLIDVSTLPWSTQSQSQQDHYVEILYKKPLPNLSHDTDQFPCPNCDNLLVNKMLQLYYEEMEKPNTAALYDGKATRGLARKKEDQNKATEDRISMTPNPHDSLLCTVRPSLRPGIYPSVYPSNID